MKDCRIIPDEANDADSFHVKAGGKEYIFRLYFVDAPETDEAFPQRVAEQATYFGLSAAQTVQLGNIAKRFTKEKLVRPFTVRTCLQDALGRSRQERFYAFIETSEGDLSELLVANGLARLHGTEGKPVGLSSPEREWQKLQRLEREAKAQKVGGWGAPSGRMTARLAKQPPKDGADSFNAFFHPERVAAAPPAEPETSRQMADRSSTSTRRLPKN
jgi:endonuclease YncB( thermonuclease family)